MASSTTAGAIIARLQLEPHPEGGWYRQTWCAETGGTGASGIRATGIEGSDSERPGGTAIHFLLEAGQRSHWHRVDAAEIWLWHAGAPIVLSISADAATPASVHRLGPDVLAGDAPQVLVPTGHWQAAAPVGGWALVSCVVVPGFSFAGFTLAPPDWKPGGPVG